MFNLITKRQANLKNDVLAGLTAVLTLIPEAVAFTFVAGIDPMMGLYGSFFIGLITALFGGRTRVSVSRRHFNRNITGAIWHIQNG